jgi:hypothetical protein
MIWTTMTVRCCGRFRAVLIDKHLTTVSVVDGYNLPMTVTNNKGCAVASCPVDLGPNCKDLRLYIFR